MGEFEILELQPINQIGLWRAKILISIKEDIEGYQVGHLTSLDVRFLCQHASPISELLEAALDAAKRSLAVSIDHVKDQSAAALLSLQGGYCDDPGDLP